MQGTCTIKPDGAYQCTCSGVEELSSGTGIFGEEGCNTILEENCGTEAATLRTICTDSEIFNACVSYEKTFANTCFEPLSDEEIDALLDVPVESDVTAREISWCCQDESMRNEKKASFECIEAAENCENKECCSTCNVGGEVSTDDKFDWRLPNRNELASLVDYTKVNGAVSDFPAIAAKGFWTSTASANETAKAWTVDFESGSVEATDKTNTKYIICVRNDEPCFGDECSSGFVPSLTPEYGAETTTAYCRFKCKENYTWNGSECVGATRPGTCTGLPANALWRTSASGTGSSFSITQSWSGSDWTPSLTGAHGSFISNQCRFTCVAEGDKFKWEGGACIPNTKTDQPCTGLPENAEWTGGFTSISRTWNSVINDFEPSSIGTFNTEADSAYCRFQCRENYTWSGEENAEGDEGECIADTRKMDCKTLPENAVWNYAPTITQTWDGKQWLPKLEPTYNVVGSEDECIYICDAGYYPLDGKCVGSPCDDDPCSGVDNASGTCLENGNMLLSYACGCDSGYYWWGKTGCRSQNVTLGNLCTGTIKCYNNGAEIVCPELQSGTGENYNFYGQDAYYVSKGVCTPQSFIIKTPYSTKPDEKVVFDENTKLEWQRTISGDTYTFYQAITYCANLEYAGYDDWRLPTMKELASILLQSSSGRVNTDYFDVQTGSRQFWSSKRYVSDTNKAWTINFGSSTSNVIERETGDAAYAICVR